LYSPVSWYDALLILVTVQWLEDRFRLRRFVVAAGFADSSAALAARKANRGSLAQYRRLFNLVLVVGVLIWFTRNR
jgi:hypothetical protein